MNEKSQKNYIKVIAIESLENFNPLTSINIHPWLLNKCEDNKNNTFLKNINEK